MPRLRACLLVPLFAASVAHAAPACKPGQAVDENSFVKIGGIEQYIQII